MDMDTSRFKDQLKIRLPEVTLVIYDPVAHELASIAVTDTMSKARFGDVHIWTDDISKFKILPGEGVKFFKAPSGLGKTAGQSIIWTDIPKFIKTSHVLNIEWDAGIADPSMWDGRYLEYDYIGAPWPWLKDGLDVGNGGFTLVSQRLLRFLHEHQAPEEYPYSFPWDGELCRNLRPRLEKEEGFRFKWAPLEVAKRFAFEYGHPTTFSAPPKVFGYHSCINWCHFLSVSEIKRRIEYANDHIRRHHMWDNMLASVQALEHSP